MEELIKMMLADIEYLEHHKGKPSLEIAQMIIADFREDTLNTIQYLKRIGLHGETQLHTVQTINENLIYHLNHSIFLFEGNVAQAYNLKQLEQLI